MVERVPPEPMVSPAPEPTMLAKPALADTTASVPLLETVLAAARDKALFPALPSTLSVCVPLAPPSRSVLIEAPPVRSTV